MKHLIILLSIIFSVTTVNAAGDNKSDIVTDTLMVSGNCGSCKSRIEKAAYIKGVKRADWNKETKKLTVTYKSSKTSSEDILKSIAAAGHDSQVATATDDAYEELPGCCRYRTGECHEE